MKAMIFAAGLGSRLKPLTDTMPKALVPVAGRPMLEHVVLKLKRAGFTEIVINIHHYGAQILDFLESKKCWGLTIHVSDERDQLLDTGGGIKKASSYFSNSNEPFLIHNVDILSNIQLKDLYEYHMHRHADATLLVSPRATTRYLLFDRSTHRLCGWIHKGTGETRPKTFQYDSLTYDEWAFSGIHVLSPSILSWMNEPCWGNKFSIMDFYLETCDKIDIEACVMHQLQLLDIGKPESLAHAADFLHRLTCTDLDGFPDFSR